MCPPHHCAGSLTSFSIIEGCSGAITPAASSPVTSDSPPPIWTSNSVTPDRASCWILPTIEVDRPTLSSASKPKRCLKFFSMPFLSSALAGTETTTLPSFFAASTVFSQSPEALGFASAANRPGLCQTANEAKKTSTERIFIKNSLVCGDRGNSRCLTYKSAADKSRKLAGISGFRRKDRQNGKRRCCERVQLRPPGIVLQKIPGRTKRDDNQAAP